MVGGIPDRSCSPDSGDRSLGVVVARPFVLAGEVGMTRVVLCVGWVGCGPSEVGLVRLVGRRKLCLDRVLLPCPTAISGESCLFKLRLPDEEDAVGPASG